MYYPLCLWHRLTTRCCPDRSTPVQDPNTNRYVLCCVCQVYKCVTNCQTVVILCSIVIHHCNILCSPIEHDSVLRVMNRLVAEGWDVEYMPLLDNGRVCVDQLKECCTESTALIALQLVNSELGTHQPVEEIAEIARKMDIKVHCDAVQAFAGSARGLGCRQ